MATGIEITRPGYDVKTYSSDTQLSFSSRFNAFKIAAQGTTTVTISNGSYSGSANLAHGLGYIPFAIVYFELASGQRFLAGTPVITGLTDYGGYCYMDGTNLVLFCNRTTDVGTVAVNVYYYVLVDPSS
jgi:hypothetical protein